MCPLRGEKRLDKRDGEESYHFAARSYGTSLRSLRLPYSVDTDKIRAEFANGVLTVMLPKCKDKEKSRKIPVQCSGFPDSSSPSGQSQPQGGGPGK